jgi:hypothetical protein
VTYEPRVGEPEEELDRSAVGDRSVDADPVHVIVRDFKILLSVEEADAVIEVLESV